MAPPIENYKNRDGHLKNQYDPHATYAELEPETTKLTAKSSKHHHHSDELFPKNETFHSKDSQYSEDDQDQHHNKILKDDTFHLRSQSEIHPKIDPDRELGRGHFHHGAEKTQSLFMNKGMHKGGENFEDARSHTSSQSYDSAKESDELLEKFKHAGEYVESAVHSGAGLLQRATNAITGALDLTHNEIKDRADEAFQRLQHDAARTTHGADESVRKPSSFHSAKSSVDSDSSKFKYHSGDYKGSGIDSGLLNRTSDAISNAVHHSGKDVHDAASYVAQNAKDSTSSIQNKIHRKAEDAKRSLHDLSRKSDEVLTKSKHHDDFKDATDDSSILHRATEAISNVFNFSSKDVEETAHHAVQKTKETASNIQDKFHQKANEAKRSLHDLSTRMSEDHSTTAKYHGDVKESKSGLLQTVTEAIGNAFNLTGKEVEETAHHAVQKTKETASHIQDNLHKKAEEAKHNLHDLSRKSEDHLAKSKYHAGNLKETAEESDSSLLHRASEAFSSVFNFTGKDVEETAHHAVQKTKETASHIQDNLHKKAEDTKHNLHDLSRKSEDVLSKSKYHAGQKETADESDSGLLHKASEAFSSVFNFTGKDVEETAHQAVQKTKETASNLKDKFHQKADEARRSLHDLSTRKSEEDYSTNARYHGDSTNARYHGDVKESGSGIIQRATDAITNALNLTSRNVEDAADNAAQKTKETASSLKHKIHEKAESVHHNLPEVSANAAAKKASAEAKYNSGDYIGAIKDECAGLYHQTEETVMSAFSKNSRDIENAADTAADKVHHAATSLRNKSHNVADSMKDHSHRHSKTSDKTSEDEKHPDHDDIAASPKDSDSGLLHRATEAIGSMFHLNSDLDESAKEEEKKSRDAAQKLKVKLSQSLESWRQSPTYHATTAAHDEASAKAKYHAGDYVGAAKDSGSGVFHRAGEYIEKNLKHKGGDIEDAAYDLVEGAVHSFSNLKSKSKDSLESFMDTQTSYSHGASADKVHSGAGKYSGSGHLHWSGNNHAKRSSNDVEDAEYDLVHETLADLQMTEHAKETWKQKEAFHSAKASMDEASAKAKFNAGDYAGAAKDSGSGLYHRASEFVEHTLDILTPDEIEDAAHTVVQKAKGASESLHSLADNAMGSIMHSPSKYAAYATAEENAASAKYHEGDYIGAAKDEGLGLLHRAEEAISKVMGLSKENTHKGAVDYASEKAKDAACYMKDKSHDATSYLHNLASEASSVVHQCPEKLAAKASGEEAAARAKYHAGDYTGALKSGGASLKYRAEEGINSVRKGAEHASDVASDLASSLKSKAHNAKSSLEDASVRAKDQIKDYVKAAKAESSSLISSGLSAKKSIEHDADVAKEGILTRAGEYINHVLFKSESTEGEKVSKLNTDGHEHRGSEGIVSRAKNLINYVVNNPNESDDMEKCVQDQLAAKYAMYVHTDEDGHAHHHHHDDQEPSLIHRTADYVLSSIPIFDYSVHSHDHRSDSIADTLSHKSHDIAKSAKDQADHHGSEAKRYEASSASKAKDGDLIGSKLDEVSGIFHRAGEYIGNAVLNRTPSEDAIYNAEAKASKAYSSVKDSVHHAADCVNLKKEEIEQSAKASLNKASAAVKRAVGDKQGAHEDETEGVLHKAGEAASNAAHSIYDTVTGRRW